MSVACSTLFTAIEMDVAPSTRLHTNKIVETWHATIEKTSESKDGVQQLQAAKICNAMLDFIC